MTQILAKKRVFTGKVVYVDEVDLDFENGKKASFELIGFDVVTGVSALPIQNGEVWLIKHYQLGMGKEGYSLPSGGLEAGEDPLERMQIELQEELGYKAGKLSLLTRAHIMPGYIGVEPGYIFLAEDLKPSKLPGDEDYSIEVVKIPIERALKMITSGEISDGRTILALLYYREFIAHPES